MEIAIFMLAIVNVIGLVYLVSLQKNKQLASQKLVKAQMAELEKRNSEQMMQIWQGTMERLDHLSHSLNDDFDRLADLTEKRLFLINEKVSARLDSGFEKTSGAYQEMLERMARIDEAQKKLEGLQNEVVSLQNILGDKKTRGIFGEVQLNHLLENVFGKNDGIYQVQAKLPNGLVCDVLLKAPEPLGKIAIDSKFPLENYRRMVDRTLSDAQRQTASKQFKEDIKKHIQDIAGKYILPGYTSDQAIMFIPAEAVYAEIYAYHQDLVDFSLAKHVWIVSPTTLMATLTTLEVLVKDQQRSKYAVQIQDELQLLAKEFERYQQRWTKLVRNVEGISKDVKDVSITADKITRRFEEISNANIMRQKRRFSDEFLFKNIFIKISLS